MFVMGRIVVRARSGVFSDESIISISMEYSPPGYAGVPPGPSPYPGPSGGAAGAGDSRMAAEVRHGPATIRAAQALMQQQQQQHGALIPFQHAIPLAPPMSGAYTTGFHQGPAWGQLGSPPMSAYQPLTAATPYGGGCGATRGHQTPGASPYSMPYPPQCVGMAAAAALPAAGMQQQQQQSGAAYQSPYGAASGAYGAG